MTKALLLLSSLVPCRTVVMSAQVPLVPERIVARDSGAIMTQLAPGVYAILHERATEDWPHGNTGVIVGEDGVLVIDSNYLPARAEADILLIRQVTDRPVRYLVNTHWHGDHTHGNGVYRERFPGLAIIGPRASEEFIALNQLKLPRGAAAADSYQRSRLAALEALQLRGSDSTGRMLSEAERTALRANIAARRHELSELAKVQVAPPTMVFDDALTLHVGNRRVELRNMGWANSPADVVIYLPVERVAFVGDIVVYPLPYTFGGSLPSWMRVLRTLEEYPVTAVVPGHGPVLADWSYPRLIGETLARVRFQVDSLYRTGKPRTATAAGVDIRDLRGRYTVPPTGRMVSEGAWEEFTRSIATQMAECVHGYRC